MLLTRLKYLCLVIILTAILIAEETTAVDLLGIAKGASTMGRGGAYLGQLDSASAVFNNFSSLAGDEDFSATFMSSKILNDTPLNVFSVAAGSFSFGYFGVKESGGYIRDEINNVSEEISYYDNNIYIATGFEFKKMELGVRMRQLQKGFSGIEEDAKGTTFDVAGRYQLGTKLSLGFEISNLLGANLKWSNGTIEKLPIAIGAGVSYLAPWSDITLFADFVNETDGMLTHMGAEYGISKALKARAGLDQKHTVLDSGAAETATNFTLGIGLDTGALKMDYAYYLDGEVSSASTHYISITYWYESQRLENKPNIDNVEVEIKEEKSLKVDKSAWDTDLEPVEENKKEVPSTKVEGSDDFWEKSAPKEPVPKEVPESAIDSTEITDDFWD